MSSVAIEIVRVSPGKPPLSRMIIDVAARNTTGENQWLLVQRQIPTVVGGVDMVKQCCVGEICYGRFFGTGGFYGFWLAPGAAITVRNLEVSRWESEGGEKSRILVRTASRLMLGEKDALSWFDGNALIVGSVVLDADAAIGMPTKKMPGDAEVTVRLVSEVIVASQMSLTE
jgi:hypothetical protein